MASAAASFNQSRLTTVLYQIEAPSGRAILSPHFMFQLYKLYRKWQQLDRNKKREHSHNLNEQQMLKTTMAPLKVPPTTTLWQNREEDRAGSFMPFH